MCRKLIYLVLLLAFGLVIGAASGQPVKINFQPPGAPVPEGYLADTSLVFADRGNGYSYGWSRAFDETRDRDVHTDQRYDTLNHLQKDDGEVWEIALANGSYNVFLVCGDADNTDQINTMDIEGTVVTDPDGEDMFDEYNVLVTVGDGRLTIQAAAGADNAKVCFIDIEPTEILTAYGPTPKDNTLLIEFQAGTLGTNLIWNAGDTAVSHDVYFGDNFDDVSDGTGGTFRVNQNSTNFLVGYGLYDTDPLPDGLVPGTTYYWRIDEVEADGDTKHTGDVWSFQVALAKAYDPTPADGAKFLDTDTDLSWEPGLGGIVQTVYFGKDYDAVDNGTIDGVPVGSAAYDPGPLEYDTTYYWRVETTNLTYGQIKGDVWSFKTLPDIPIADPNLVGWWKFEAGEGTKALDWSGHNNHGTMMAGGSGSVQWVPGLFNLALEFPGDNQGWVELPPGGITSAKGSIVMWINTTQGNSANNDEGHIWWTCDEFDGNGGGGQDEMHLNMDDPGEGQLDFFWEEDGAGSDIMLEYDNIGSTGWRHVAATWDLTDGMRLYVDGQQVDYAEHNTNVKNFVVMRLGRPWDGDRWYAGLMDDVRLFDYAISAAQINEIMSKGEDPLRAGSPMPFNNAAVSINEAMPLTWLSGEKASKHDVYFGTDKDAVENADTTDTTGIYRIQQVGTSYTPPEGVELGGGPYYWRIDEINTDGTVSKGIVWSFTILDYVLVDNMDSYNNTDNPIWRIWLDGEGWIFPPPGYPGNGTGAASDLSSDTALSMQSLMYYYDNDGTNFWGTSGKAFYSEVTKTLSAPRDWTAQGVKALSLWFRGYPASVGGFIEGPAGTYTMTAAGADIEDESDEFHFAWKVLNGAGSITAKVESVENTHAWAKAGVMIRDTLDADSAHAMVAVTPGNGIWFGRRPAAGDGTDTDEQEGITAPYWVKVERTLGGMVRASYSANGSDWTPLGDSTPVTMDLPLYIGLALTSHQPGVACEAVFSNVTSDGTGAWINEDIGLSSNEAEPMYVAIANNTGAPAVSYYGDPNASLRDTWTPWNIDLKDFADKGIDLTDVNSISIGFGDRNNPQLGGSGTVYFENIGLYQAKCALDKVTLSEADFTSDCIVDYRDLEIMANDWLMGDFTRPGPLLVNYKFDEGSGAVAADSSGNGNDGAFSGTASWAPDGVGGFAAAFDSGSGEVKGANMFLNGLSAISFGAWIKSNATETNAGFIIFAEPAGNDQRGLRYDSDGSVGDGTNVIKYGVATEEDSHENESAINVQTTDWQHLMVTWNSGEAAKLYINGVLDTPTAEDDVIGGTTAGYTTLIVGRGGKDETGSWDGLVDDVRVYEVALTAAEVQTVMNGGDLPVVDVYVPLTSVANISDDEPANSKKVNFKDFAVLADQWLEEVAWPEW